MAHFAQYGEFALYFKDKAVSGGFGPGPENQSANMALSGRYTVAAQTCGNGSAKL